MEARLVDQKKENAEKLNKLRNEKWEAEQKYQSLIKQERENNLDLKV